MARLFKIIGSLKNGHEKSAFVFVFIYLPHDYNNYKKIPKKKCWKKWRGGLKETIDRARLSEKNLGPGLQVFIFGRQDKYSSRQKLSSRKNRI